MPADPSTLMWLTSLALLTAGLDLALSAVWEPLGAPAAWATSKLLVWTEAIVAWGASRSWGHTFVIGPSPAWLRAQDLKSAGLIVEDVGQQCANDGVGVELVEGGIGVDFRGRQPGGAKLCQCGLRRVALASQVAAHTAV